jgi:anti-sigma B factor antagonist
MQIAERKVGGITIVDVTGRIVANDSPGRLKDKVTSLIFQGEKQIVLNLANVNYVDSSGLGEMVACHGTAVRGGGVVKLANTGKRIQDLLVMTKLLTVFESHDSEDAAIKSFAASGT